MEDACLHDFGFLKRTHEEVGKEAILKFTYS